MAGALLEGKGSLENIRGACRECRFRNEPSLSREVGSQETCSGPCVRSDATQQIAGFDAAAGKAGGDPVAVLFKADKRSPG